MDKRYYVAVALYFPVVCAVFWPRLKRIGLVDPFDVLCLLVIIVFWPLHTAISVVFHPLRWLIARNWPVCNFCNRKTRLAIRHHNWIFCERCYSERRFRKNDREAASAS